MKIGIIGGSFDPLHSEHISLIEGSRKALSLDKIVMFPSYNPPHKDKNLCSFEQRLAMINLYASGKDYIIVDTIENELKLANSYTYIILPQIIAKYPNAELYFLVGGDSMYRFASWVKPDVISALIKIVVVLRKGYDCAFAIDSAKKAYNADITVLNDIDLREISSTELKCRLELDYNVEDYILPEIYNYINERHLYKQFGDLVAIAKTKLSPSTYMHSVRTAVFALRYAGILGIDYKKAFIASFLHDIAKCSAPLKAEYPTKSPAVIHQYDGAVVAKNECGISDPAILSAIEYHTTGKKEMSELAKLVYVADKLEENRSYDGVAELRSALNDDFQQGFRMLVAHEYNYLKSCGKEVDNLTAECNEYYNKSIQN